MDWPYSPTETGSQLGTTSNIIIALGSFIDVSGNNFDRSYTGNTYSARYMGSAITFHQTIAFGNITIANIAFTNSQNASHPNQEQLTYQLQPVISYSLYENLFKILNQVYTAMDSITQMNTALNGKLEEINSMLNFWTENGYYTDITIQSLTVNSFAWGVSSNQVSSEFDALPSSFSTLFKFYISKETLESITSSTTFTSGVDNLGRSIPFVRLYVSDAVLDTLIDNSYGCLFMQSYSYLLSVNNITLKNSQHLEVSREFFGGTAYSGFFCLLPPSVQSGMNPGTIAGPLFLNGDSETSNLTNFIIANLTYENNTGILLSTLYYDGTDTLLDTISITDSSLANSAIGSSLLVLQHSSATLTSITVTNFSGRVFSAGYSSNAGLAWLNSTISSSQFTDNLMYMITSKVTLSNMVFSDNHDGASSSALLTSCDGSLLCADGSSELIITGSTIANNSAIKGISSVDSAFQLSVGSTTVQGNSLYNFVYCSGSAELTDCQFVENTVTGALISPSAYVVLTVTASNFTMNYCSGCYAIVFYLTTGAATVSNSYFISNDATNTGAIPSDSQQDDLTTILTARSSTVEFGSCVFQYNKGQSKYLFKLEIASLTLDSSVFEHNYGTGGNGIDAIATNIFINNTRFTNNTSFESSQLLSLAVDSQGSQIINTIFEDAYSSLGSPSYSFAKILNYKITFTNCTFRHSLSMSSAIYADSTRLAVTFQNCNFENNTGLSSSNSAGALVGNALFTITSCSFTNNSGNKASHIYFLSNTAITIAGTSFVDHQNDGVLLSSVKSAAISNSNFIAASDSEVSRGLEMIDVTTSAITNTTFTNHSNPLGLGAGIRIAVTAVSFSESTLKNHSLDRCTFTNNSALSGGGFSVETGDYNITVTNTKFYSNQAVQSGGAVYYNAEITGSFFQISGLSTFEENEAGVSGGAVFTQGQPAQFIGNSLEFTKNTATYGKNIGSYPVKMQFYNAPSYNQSLGASQFIANLSGVDYDPSTSENSRLLDSSATNITLASGKQLSPPLVFALFDEYDQLYNIDNSSILTVSGKQSASGETPFFSAASTFQAQAGIYILEDFIVSLGVNTSTDLTFTTDAFNSNPARTDLSYFSLLTITTEFRACQRGERLTLDGECIDCEPGEYSFTPYKVAGCSDCFDSDTDCLGGDAIGPQAGFWRLSPWTARSVECPFGTSACLGHSPEGNLSEYHCDSLYNETFCQTGWCAAEYTGNLCSECVAGYSRTAGGCIDCKGVQYTVITSLAIPIIVIFVILTIRSAIKIDPSKVEEEENLPPILMKILVNYMQLVGIVSSFNFNWSSALDTLNSVSTTASTALTQVINPDCLAFSSVDFSKFPIDRFFLSLLFLTLAPIGIILGSVILWRVYYRFKYKQRRHNPELSAKMKSNIATTIIVLMFMIYNSIVTESIYSFQ